MARFISLTLEGGKAVWVNVEHVDALTSEKPTADGSPISHLVVGRGHGYFVRGTPEQIMVRLQSPTVANEGEAVALLENAVSDWSEEMESDLPIQGSDAVDWLCQFFENAKDLLAKRDVVAGERPCT